MTALTRWITKRRRAIASTLVVSVVAGVPLTIAALHPGFPVDDVDLNARDVWVTNGEQLLGGRLNRQIEELNGSVVAASADFDVRQDGDSLFLVDPEAGRIESVSASTTEVTSAIDIPVGSEVTYGGQVLAILSPEGDLWTIAAVGDLVFNYTGTDPNVRLGDDAHAVVTPSGAVVAVSPEQKEIHRIEALGAEVVTDEFPSLGAFELTAVGERAVAFDTTTSTVVTEDGTEHALDQEALRVQQVGEENDAVWLATGDGLLSVDLGSGDETAYAADIRSPVTDPDAASSPVFLDGCAHGAWAGAQKYLLACESGPSDGEVQAQGIAEPTQGSRLEFRRNRAVIALNDLTNGNVWLVEDNMRLVDNWEDVTPPEESEGEVGDEKSATQSLADTLAERTENNRPPTAVDDVFGVRPGKTTILPVLDNDTDPDGDVLVVTSVDPVAETTGKLDFIDGGRALQFTPSADFVGGFVVGYQVQDGRPGGSASARLTVDVRPVEINEVPLSARLSATTAESGQTVEYNVLNDWTDPDGDDLYLVGASPKSGDLVQFTPDGFVTFSHRTSELGVKEVSFLVSDGIGEPVPGTLTVDVQPAGALDPIGTPDFATTFPSEPVVVSPLDNDISPSGIPVTLAGVQEAGGGSTTFANGDKGTVTFSAPDPGVYYVQYTLAAGAKTSLAIIRIDVVEKSTDDAPPVAVKDTAYLRGDAPTTVSVLSNDVSPTGRILAVQSTAVPADATAKGLVVELLASTLLRITSPQALTSQVSFTYTISDGVNTATAGVTIVPVPPLTKHQPPVALVDPVTVRAGDIVTVDVLENDYHPDDATMSVVEELVTPPSAGLAFVNADTVRYQAPDTAGEYRLDYAVTDEFGETSASTVILTVTPLDEENNQDPAPDTIVARVLAGGSVRVDIPLDQVDPDGDSVQLLGFPNGPALGTIAEQGNDYFVYDSIDGLTGTDEFSYEVVDAFGATGTATAKVAVIPQPSESLPPNAVPDSVAVRPGKTAQVDLMANDSDPQGALIKVSKTLIDVPEGIEVEVLRKRFLIIEAPDEEQSFSLRYELTNTLGGRTVSYVQVQVTPDAPLLPPTAEDVVIPVADIAGEDSVTVDLFESAFDPGGRTDDLEISIEGPNKASAVPVGAAGKVEVTPTDRRQAIAYRVTNTVDDLDAMAFILVPATASDEFDDPPIIDPAVGPQVIRMNETKEWDLSDIVVAPSGRDVIITDAGSVSGVQSNGDEIYVDQDTLRFTPARDYRGPASVVFTVTDGSSPNDPKGNVATLRLPITVGDPEFRDIAPTFTTPTVSLEVGEQSVIDLRSSTGHPNPQILQEIAYSNVSGSGRVDAQLSGSQVTLTTPRNTPKGTTVTLGVTLRWAEFDVPGQIVVTVVSSSRPLPVAVTDSLEAKRGDGASLVPVLSNDSNPFQSTGEPLKLLSAQVDNSGQPATVSVQGDTVRIQPNPSLKSGEIVVIYRIGDATDDPDRQVNGTVSLVVSDVPDQVAKPARSPDSAVGGDGSASFVFQAPATNGKPITSYEIRTSPGVANTPSCTAGAQCTLSGLQNGTPYTLSARAINERGAGEWSISSEPVTPYGTPAVVGKPTVTSQSRWAPATITWQWPAVAGTGGSTSYEWRTSNGQTGSGGGTSATISGAGAGSYTIAVTAVNTGGKRSPSASTSDPTQVQNQPVPDRPGAPNGNRSDRFAPASITWNWQGVADTGGLQYVIEMSNGQSRTVNGTSATFTGLGAGDYTAVVTARNNAGAGQQSPRSGAVQLENAPPPPPNPTVTLRKGQAVSCASGNAGSGCFKYDVSLADFGGGNHNISLYCDGAFFRDYTFSGNSFTSTAWCGFPNAWAVVDGVRSNTVDFRP
ncbi:MAG: hypothetical protein RI885_1193 [Actinomycetota bacterium]